MLLFVSTDLFLYFPPNKIVCTAYGGGFISTTLDCGLSKQRAIFYGICFMKNMK